MSPKEEEDIVAHARLSGARTGDIITLVDGRRFVLRGRSLHPVPDDS